MFELEFLLFQLFLQEQFDSCNDKKDTHNKLYKKYTKLMKHNLELIPLIKKY